MIWYIENPKDSTHTKKTIRAKKWIQQSYTTLTTHKTQHTKICCISITSNEQYEKEIKTTILFTIASKKYKILRNKLHQGGARFTQEKLQNITERK